MLYVISGLGNISFTITKINFSRLMNKESIENINLTIYYRHTNYLTLTPYDIDELVYGGSDNIISIPGSELKNYRNSLQTLSKTEVTPIEPQTYFDAFVYYVFKNRNHKVFEVGMWGAGGSRYMIVNGIEVEENEYFYDFVRQFLPEDAARQLDIHIGRSE